MMTEFKVNLDLEKQVIKQDIKGLELQLAQTRGYLDQLHTLKRKVDTAKRLLKVSMSQEDKESKERQEREVRENARRLAGEFKHYVRSVWISK